MNPLTNVYLAHPLGSKTPAGVRANIERAKDWVRWVIVHYGVAVVANWIYYCEVLDDHNPEHRALGMHHSREILTRCDEVWLVGGCVSPGMLEEALLAWEHSMPVRDFTRLGLLDLPSAAAPTLENVPLWKPTKPTIETRQARQAVVAEWCVRAFGQAHATNLEQRGLRFLEEAVEAFQSAGGSAKMAHKLVDYIFERPAGDLAQEFGGLGVTLLAFANAAGIDADAEEAREVDRILRKPPEHWRARNDTKNAAGFNVTPEDAP